MEGLLRRRAVQIRMEATNRLEYSPGLQRWELGNDDPDPDTSGMNAAVPKATE